MKLWEARIWLDMKETCVTEPSRREWPPQELTATGSSGRGHSSRVCQGPTKVTLKGPNVGTSIL